MIAQLNYRAAHVWNQLQQHATGAYPTRHVMGPTILVHSWTLPQVIIASVLKTNVNWKNLSGVQLLIKLSSTSTNGNFKTQNSHQSASLLAERCGRSASSCSWLYHFVIFLSEYQRESIAWSSRCRKSIKLFLDELVTEEHSSHVSIYGSTFSLRSRAPFSQFIFPRWPVMLFDGTLAALHGPDQGLAV